MQCPAALQPIDDAPHACPYLPGLTARFEQYWAPELSRADFERLIEQGFRHFGFHYFRPACPGPPGASHCGACLPLRVPTAAFRPSRSQRRVLRRGAAVRVELGTPVFTEERFELYLKHQARFRARAAPASEPAAEPPDPDDFVAAFTLAPPWTREMTYFVEGRLIGVGYLDLTPRVASSIYFYFDPAWAKLSPGTLSILCEVATAARLHIPHYYLGYAIARAPAMRYKLDFRPHEILDGARWTAPPEPPPGAPPETLDDNAFNRRVDRFVPLDPAAP